MAVVSIVNIVLIRIGGGPVFRDRFLIVCFENPFDLNMEKRGSVGNYKTANV